MMYITVVIKKLTLNNTRTYIHKELTLKYSEARFLPQLPSTVNFRNSPEVNL